MKVNSTFKLFSMTSVYLWLGALALAPLLLMLLTSFLSYNDSQLIIWHFTLSNYHRLFSDIYFIILLRSLELALISTSVCLLIGYPTAFILAQLSRRWKAVLLLLMIIPFWTSSLIRTYALLAILKTKGLLNSALLGMGLIHQPLQLLYTNTAVLIGCVYSLLPFMILPLYANIEKLDHRLIEAAKDLGASQPRLFVRIILPLTMPGILAGCLLVFLPAMTLFYIPILLGGAKSLLLGNLIQDQFLAIRDWPGGAASSIMLTLLMLLLILIYRHFNKNKKNQELL